MVYFYESNPDNSVGSDGYQIILGKDKFENDWLIKYGYKELNYMWFHADKYSSGHVYLKLRESQRSLDDVPSDVVNDCMQLCKSESIQGNKLPQCTILVTPWTNLRKNKYMKPGEVSFKSMKQCQRKQCYARDNMIINRLVKTRVEVISDVSQSPDQMAEETLNQYPPVEAFLHRAKKSKNGDFFTDYIRQNKDLLLSQEKERKTTKKMSKRKKKRQEEDEFYNNDDTSDNTTTF